MSLKQSKGLKSKKGLVSRTGLKRTPFKKPDISKTDQDSQFYGNSLKRSGELKRTGQLRPISKKRLEEGQVFSTFRSSLMKTTDIKKTTLKRSTENNTNQSWTTFQKEGTSSPKKITRLKMNPKLIQEAKKYHDLVWMIYEDICALCGHPGSTDAAHVLKKSFLGPKLRYADHRFARPAHRLCHMEQEENRIMFPLAIRLDAVRAYNILRPERPLPEPTK